MELRTVNGELRPRDAFKLIATGLFLGTSVTFLPIVALVTLATFSEGVRPFGGLMSILLIPLVLAMQSVVLGWLAVLGLWLYQRRQPIRVLVEDAAIPTRKG